MKNILYKLASLKQRKSDYLIQEFLRNMPDKEGYNKVYMPYCNKSGFYYVIKELKNEKNKVQ